MKEQKNKLEWAVFAAGVALIALSIGYLAYDALAGDNSPAEVQIEASAPESRNGGFSIPLRISNSGGGTAEEVLVRAELHSGGEVVEQVELHLPYLPRKSVRQAVVVLRTDPALGKFEVRVVSYQKP